MQIIVLTNKLTSLDLRLQPSCSGNIVLGHQQLHQVIYRLVLDGQEHRLITAEAGHGIPLQRRRNRRTEVEPSVSTRNFLS